MRSPTIKGNIEISKRRSGVFIGGDPEGLRSLAKLLNWLADIDQECDDGIPVGERRHVHLHACDAVDSFNSLTPTSVETEIGRLDAKGTGSFPNRYYTTTVYEKWRQHTTRRATRQAARRGRTN